MKRFAMVLAVFVGLTYAACGGGSSPTPTPTIFRPTINPDEARQVALEHAADVFIDPANVDVTGEHMLAWQANEKLTQLGLEPFLLLASTVPTCPPGAHCPFPPLRFDEPGYLFLVTGRPNPGWLQPSDPPSNATAASWVSDNWLTTSSPPQYPFSSDEP